MTAALDIPPGFHALRMTGAFIEQVGPLYLKRDGDELWVGFRVEERHTNPMRICHGGMLASFADMLLPLSIHRKSEVGMRFLPTVSLQIDYLAPAPLGAWVEGNAQVLREGARKARLKVFGGANAPYIWVRTPKGVTSWQAFDKILNEANVVITPGSGFGSKGEGYFRISAFNSRANAEEVARRLQELKW